VNHLSPIPIEPSAPPRIGDMFFDIDDCCAARVFTGVEWAKISASEPKPSPTTPRYHSCRHCGAPTTKDDIIACSFCGVLK
jgi:hypothetical protein